MGHDPICVSPKIEKDQEEAQLNKREPWLGGVRVAATETCWSGWSACWWVGHGWKERGRKTMPLLRFCLL